jgi:hypothetical protein
MTDYDLTRMDELGRRYERRRKAADETREELLPEILAALAAGVPQVKIVKASRLTRERVRQIERAAQRRAERKEAQ